MRRGSLLGVGEALKREIAGLVLVCELLWGFACRACGGFDPAGWLNGPGWIKRGVGVASILWIRAIFYERPPLLHSRQLDQRTVLGSQVIWPAVKGVVRNVWRAFHAVALCVFGGALGC